MRNISFINAGAGSGKTHRLTEILTENLKQGTCRADQVILTTFTKKAAGEFRSRARESLIAEGLTAESDLLSSAAIGTVNSVETQLIQKYWYHLGIGVDLDVMADEDVDFFFNQALANIPTQDEIGDLNRITRQLQLVNHLGRFEASRWKADLISMINLALTNNISDFTGSRSISKELFGEVYTESELDLGYAFIQTVLQEIEAFLPTDRKSGANTRSQKEVRSLLQKSSYDNLGLFSLSRFLNGLPAATGRLPSVVNLGHMLSQPHRYPGVNEMIEKYQTILFDITERSLDRFREYKDEHRLISYTDMEVKLLELLSDSKVRAEISRSYKQVYVDEFQDSSPIQVEIFVKLSEIVEKSWWVGDPKQSIYSFRGTDPVLIKSIVDVFDQKDIKDLLIDNLPNSWRTRPEIVNLHNAIFTEALADQVHNKESIALDAVRNGESFNTAKGEYPLLHWHMKYQGGFSNHKFNGCFINGLRDLLDNKIRVEDRKLSSYDSKDATNNVEVLRPLNPGDIAILRSSNDSISALAEALREQGFEVAAFEHGLGDTAEIHLFKAMLKYLLDPGDTSAKAMILILDGRFSDPEKLLDDRLDYLHAPDAPQKPDSYDEEDDNEEYIAYMQYIESWNSDHTLLMSLDQLRETFTLYDMATLVELMIYSTNLPDVVSHWNKAEQRRNNLLSVVKLAGRYDERCKVMKIGASANGFLNYLKDLPGDQLTQSASTGKNAINISTYHKAKGLEWPVVILLDLHKDKLVEKDLILGKFHGVSIETEEEFEVESPLKGRKIALLPSPISNKAVPENLRRAVTTSERYQRIYSEALNERKRLLYVGMTRARDYLLTTSSTGAGLPWLQEVSGINDLLEKIKQSDTTPFNSDLYKTGIPIQITHLEERPGEIIAIESDRYNKIYKKPGKQVYTNDPKYRNPSSEKAPEGIKAEILKDLNVRITQYLAEREDELGNCLHSIYYHYHSKLNKIDFIKTATSIRDQYGLRENIPEPEQIYRSISLFFEFLEETYGKPSKIYRELPLQLKQGERIFRGEADLVWETDRGMVLIDYKSFPGTKYQLLNSGNEKHYAGHYGGQLKKYKEMVEAGHPENKKVIETLLYYSVIGLIIKLDL